MKQNDRDCKIVQDLLPNYVEDLTEEVTNEYIEEHLKTCSNCRKALENMNGEIEVEEVHQEKEIQYLKNIRKRVKRTIALSCTLIIIIASCVVCYVYNNVKIPINNYTFLRASYVLENQKGTKDGKLYCTLIAMIDEKGICKSVRVEEKGYTKEIMIEKIERSKDNNKTVFLMNSIMDQESLRYNLNIWNGYKKEELKQKLEEMYYEIDIVEI